MADTETCPSLNFQSILVESQNVKHLLEIVSPNGFDVQTEGVLDWYQYHFQEI